MLLGNLFLFSDIDPLSVDTEVIDKIARSGMRTAHSAGFRPGRGYHPKVVPYRITKDGAKPAVRTASFYHGEQHRSFPGSAGMALAAFLEQKQSEAGGRPWRIRHPSGDFEVRLGYTASARSKRLLWTEFTTPTRLVGWGAAALPWRRGDG